VGDLGYFTGIFLHDPAPMELLLKFALDVDSGTIEPAQFIPGI
jgi:hypothetical protein